MRLRQFYIIQSFIFFFTGVTISLSTQINGKNFKEGGHNAGFSLELEA